MRTLSVFLLLAATAPAQETRIYQNHLTPVANPKPLLADHPDFIEPVKELTRFEAPVLVELTAFGTAVVMNHRYHHTLRRPARTSRPEPSPI